MTGHFSEPGRALMICFVDPITSQPPFSLKERNDSSKSENLELCGVKKSDS